MLMIMLKEQQRSTAQVEECLDNISFGHVILRSTLAERGKATKSPV